MVHDAYGQNHPIAGGAVRIVSLVPSITELLCELGLAPQLVGCTEFCVHPSSVIEKITKVGGTKNVGMDVVRKLAPTHVIVNIDENKREVFDDLKGFVPHVVVTHPNAPNDNIALYKLLGTMFSREKEAMRLIQELERVMEDVHSNCEHFPRQRVLYLIWRKPWMTVSTDTYISRTLSLINLETQPRKSVERYPKLKAEELAKLPLDLCLLSSEPFPFQDKHVAEIKPLLRTQCPIKIIDGEMVSWYGSRAIAGLSYLAAFAQQIREETT